MTSMLIHVLDILFPLALFSLSGAVRIRRSGVAGYDDPYGLTNAFSEMDRPRRDDYRTILRKRVMENDDSYFNPNAVSNLDIDPIDYLRSSGYVGDGYLSGYGYNDMPSLYEALKDNPLPYEEFERGYGPQKRTAYNPHRVVPTIDELRSIFGEADVPMKRLAPVKRQEPQKTFDESAEDGDEESEISEESEKANGWRRLINAAEELSENDDAVETDQDETEDIEDEADKDLEAALGDSEVNVDDTDDKLENDYDGNDLESPPVQNELETQQLQSKSKRASSVGDSSDYVLGLLKEISYLRNRLDAEEMLRKLQDRENDYLANALKYATLDQIEESDKFVSDEYNDIAKATETEELIQKLMDGLEEQAIETEEEEEEDEEEATNSELDDLIGPEAKRSGEDSYNEEQWLDNPVNEQVGLGAILEDNDDGDELNGEDYLGSERPIDITYPDDVSEDADDEDVETAIANEQNGEENLGQELLLAKLINNLSPETLQNVISDLKNKEAEVLENSVCSPLSELSQNCAFADAKGIPIDEDARNLCIRHQVCYTCGSSLGLSAKRCDDGYKGTVIAECENDVKCVRAAAFFLQLMSTRYHRYEEYSPQQCSNPCVADFIYGV